MVNNNIYVYTVNNHCLHYYIDDTSHEPTRMLTSENPTIINSEIYYKTCSNYYFLLIGDINGHSWMINATTTALLKKGNKIIIIIIIIFN